MAKVTFRPYRPGDEVAINEGFNAVFGLQRSLDEWRWKFPEQPEGRFIMLAVDPSGRVLAHYGAVVGRVQFGDRTVRAGQIVDAYSREEVRGTRVFSTCYEHFISAFGNPEGLPLMFGFPGRRHYDMGLKALKYIPICSVPYWSRRVRRRIILPAWRFEVRHGFDGDEVNDLWRRAAFRYDVTVVRDVGWLARRYRERPGVEYQHLSVGQRGHTRAWAVARAQDGVLRLAALDRLASRLRCARLELWLGNDTSAERTLYDRGWRRQPCPLDMLMVARSFSPLVDLDRMQRGCYVTMGDSDLV
ncbi:MAG: hypothetical protein B7X11_00350 [Acidobacteria bacterium 37-65-4]|nr:MAG: hypothetical protein B7X11_00350 [Acidobacteria bacterium 37-65-4]